MKIHLMNDYTQERVKNSEGVTVLECRCAYTPARYVQMCDAHFQPWHERHQRAHAEHVTVQS